MDLVPVVEDLARMRLAAVDDKENGPVVRTDGEVLQHKGERRPRRSRDVKLTPKPLRGLALQRGVQANGDYQLKTLSRSASAVS